jgi:hypothetical protein
MGHARGDDDNAQRLGSSFSLRVVGPTMALVIGSAMFATLCWNVGSFVLEPSKQDRFLYIVT